MLRTQRVQGIAVHASQAVDPPARQHSLRQHEAQPVHSSASHSSPTGSTTNWMPLVKLPCALIGDVRGMMATPHRSCTTAHQQAHGTYLWKVVNRYRATKREPDAVHVGARRFMPSRFHCRPPYACIWVPGHRATRSILHWGVQPSHDVLFVLPLCIVTRGTQRFSRVFTRRFPAHPRCIKRVGR